MAKFVSLLHGLKATCCVDGRPTLALLRFLGYNRYEVVDPGRGAIGPSFLGGGLMFVAYLVTKLNYSLERAFDITEKALMSAGLQPMVHVDLHGVKDPLNMTTDEIAAHVREHPSGCGFAKYAWGDEATDVIKLAMKRGWLIQVLYGEHQEAEAFVNEKLDQTRKVTAAQQSFNLDVALARQVWVLLGRQLDKYEISMQGPRWMRDTYAVVVATLAPEIEQIQEHPAPEPIE